MNQPPQQPGWGQPQQPYAPIPPQPRKSNTGKIVGFSCLGIIAALVIIGGCSAVLMAGSDAGDDMQKTDPPAAAADEGKSEEKTKDDKAAKSQLETFRACVAKNGTPTEKKAVKHVTKVAGADETNGVLDAPEVFTDYTGGMMGPHQKDGKLIASAFGSCYDSENGLVTVYDADGEMLANGSF